MKINEYYLERYKILRVYKDNEDVCVLLAEHIQLHSYWIIKKLNKKSNLFDREMDILKGIRNPGIPLIVDVIDEEDHLIIIREYVEGQNLDEYMDVYLRNNPGAIGLPQEQVIAIGLDLCKIVRFLHEGLSRPLIFRDMKPGNIIIDSSGSLKLIDFGIARYHDYDKSKDTQYLGTQGFAAPEQYGFRQSDVRTDVFGTAATLYYLMTHTDLGKPPYRLDSFRNKRPDGSEELEKILLKACSINMNQRYDSIRELENELSKLVIDHKKKELISEMEGFTGKIIDFRSLIHGTGSTYMAIGLGLKLIKQGKKVLYIDVSGDLDSLEYQSGSYEKNHLLYYKDIPIMNFGFWLEKGYSLKEDLKNVDCMIIDYGVVSGNQKDKNKNELDKIGFPKEELYSYCMTTLCPWHMEIFEENLLSISERDMTYLVNLTWDKSYKEIDKSIEKVTMHYVPFVPIEEIDKNGVFQVIIKEIGVEDLCKKEQGYLGRIISKTDLVSLIKR